MSNLTEESTRQEFINLIETVKDNKFYPITSNNNSQRNILKFATFNVAQAEEKKIMINQWDNRFQKVVDLINNCGADIIALQGLRNLETSKVGVKEFLNKLKLDHAYQYYCEYNVAFCAAILYNRSKYYPVDFHQFHYHGTPQNDRICFGAKFKCVSSEKYVWVFTTHLDLEEKKKWQSVDRLIKEFDEKHRDPEPIVIGGNFNFFDDLEGIQQREKMLEWFEDFAYPLEGLSGTFLGFDHDPEKKEIDAMFRIDHIFCKNVKKVGQAKPVGVTKDLLENRTYPSRHIMITVEIEF